MLKTTDRVKTNQKQNNMYIIHSSAKYTVNQFAVENLNLNSSLCILIMAALRSRCGHYIFVLWFLLSIFFPRLFSAIAD